MNPPPPPPPVPAAAAYPKSPHRHAAADGTTTTHKKRQRAPPSSMRRELLPPDFLQEYELPKGGELGRGAFAIVRRCVEKKTRQQYAAKIIDLRPIKLKGELRLSRVLREVTILQSISHPNIVHLHAVFQNEHTLVICMELIHGKELFFEILERNHYNEVDARPIFKQLGEALRYLHSHNIVHRDVKPENVLLMGASGRGDGVLSSASPPVIVKLLDFGLSKLIDTSAGGSQAKSFVGTRAYLAPEVELLAHGQGKEYGFSADIWSLGAVLHVMLVAKFPEFDVVHRINQEGTLTPFSGVLKVEGLGLWDHLSPAAKDLIKRLMTPNPAKRLTAVHARAHPWAQGYDTLPADYHGNSQQQLEDHWQGDDSQLPHHHHHHAQHHQHPHHSAISTIAKGSTMHPASCMGDGATAPNASPGRTDKHAVGFAGTTAALSSSCKNGASSSNPPTTSATITSRTTSQPGTLPPHVASDPIATAPVELRLGLLVKVQSWISEALGVAFHLMLSENGQVASEAAYCVRSGAVVCRHELHLTVKLLRKVHEVSALVLSVFPDLTLALKEGELELAQSFFISIKSWLSEIRKEVQEVQRSNEQATVQMSRIIKKCARELVGSHKLIQYQRRVKHGQPPPFDADPNAHKKQCRGNGATDTGHAGTTGDAHVSLPLSTRDDDKGESSLTDEEIFESLLPAIHCDETYPIEGEYDTKVDELAQVLNDLLPAEAVEPLRVVGETAGATRQLEDKQISQVIICLQRLDRILERLDSFWARCEVDLDLMIRRGDHIRNLISNAHGPETVARLNSRLGEYATFWGRVSLACERYLSGISETTVAKLYGFLEDDMVDDGDNELPQPDAQGGIVAHGTSYPASSKASYSGEGEESTTGEFSNDEEF